MNNKNKLFGLIVGAVIVGLIFGSLVTNVVIRYNKQTQQERFSLLAKRTLVDNPNNPIVNFTTLRNDLESYVQDLEMSDEIASASVYFEYLPTGVSVNVNENNEAIGASLVKVPFVMTLYRLEEEGKVDLDTIVPLKQEWLNSQYGTLYQKGVGYEITLREAARLALKDSDNTAILLISKQIENISSIQDVFDYLDMKFTVDEDERVIIGARSYSSVMKCLYVACYNSKEHAQEILTYLTESTFDNRLTSLIPDDVKVAHKIGTFSTKNQSDCGIVYVPERNYILCVMVEGDDPIASRTIAVISSKVYTYVSNASY
jgi:beta-lactamase class A